MNCEHKRSIENLEDRTGWVVGWYCDRCGKFWRRKGIPSFKERLKDKEGR